MKIPKIIHQIWIGPDDPPPYMNTWKNINPEFEYILWNNENIKTIFPLINQHLYDQYDNETRNVWNGRANLLRIEILYKYGGIYVDADCECLRKLEGDFLNEEFFAVYINEKARKNRVANGVIGSIPSHPILHDYIYILNKYKNIEQPSHVFSGPTFFTNILNKSKHKFTILPSYYFYPTFFEANCDYTGEFKSFSIHHWHTTYKHKNLKSKSI